MITTAAVQRGNAPLPNNRDLQGLGKVCDQGEARQMPQVSRAIQDQEKIIACVSENLRLLAVRLQPIIPPQPPDGDDPNPQISGLCLIAEQLHSNNRQLDYINGAIAALLQIVEV